MKARHIIGILILILCVLVLGPMVFLPGMSIDGKQMPGLFASVFGVPALVLLLIGALTVGGPYRVMASAWTLLAGALYGGFVLLTVVPMMQSPDFQEMMRASQAQQGMSMDMNMDFSHKIPVFLFFGLVFTGLGGLAHYYFGKGAGSAGSLSLANWRGPEADEASPGVTGPVRPVSITVFACLLIIFATLSFLAQIYPGLESQRVAMRMATDMTGVSYDKWLWLMGSWNVMMLICGVFFLRGANWSRWLFIVATVANLLVAQFWYSMPLWPLWASVLWLFFPIYVLFIRKPAIRFFRGDAAVVIA